MLNGTVPGSTRNSCGLSGVISALVGAVALIECKKPVPAWVSGRIGEPKSTPTCSALAEAARADKTRVVIIAFFIWCTSLRVRGHYTVRLFQFQLWHDGRAFSQLLCCRAGFHIEPSFCVGDHDIHARINAAAGTALGFDIHRHVSRSGQRDVRADVAVAVQGPGSC